MSEYPVGAKWRAVNDIGQIGEIWLEEKAGKFECWRWSVTYQDGSGYESDWQGSYRACHDEIPIWNVSGRKLIFRRVK